MVVVKNGYGNRFAAIVIVIILAAIIAAWLQYAIPYYYGSVLPTDLVLVVHNAPTGNGSNVVDSSTTEVVKGSNGVDSSPTEAGKGSNVPKSTEKWPLESLFLSTCAIVYFIICFFT